MNYVLKIKQYINQHFAIPAHIDDRFHRWYGLSFLLYPAAFVLHFLFILLFWTVGERELAYFNIGSCILFIVVLHLTYRGWLYLGVFLANIEVVAHAIFATLMMGWSTGFHYLILVTPAAIFLAPKGKEWIKYFISTMNMLAYLSVYYLSHQAAKVPYEIQAINIANIVSLFFLLALIGLGYSVGAAQAEKTIHLAHEKSKKLLHNILPKNIANKLKDNNKTIAESYDEATVMFIDLVGFTRMFKKHSAQMLVGLLNEIFSIIDDLVVKYRLEKIKTIGDAYMIAAGVPVARPDHADAMCSLALELVDVLNIYNIENNLNIEFRIGINSGPVVAGVIGKNKFIFDLWGDSVNIASRMESHGTPGRIQVGPCTYEKLKNHFHFEKRGFVGVKGIGEVETYYLVGKIGQHSTEDTVELELLSLSKTAP